MKTLTKETRRILLIHLKVALVIFVGWGILKFAILTARYGFPRLVWDRTTTLKTDELGDWVKATAPAADDSARRAVAKVFRDVAHKLDSGALVSLDDSIAESYAFIRPNFETTNWGEWVTFLGELKKKLLGRNPAGAAELAALYREVSKGIWDGEIIEVALPVASQVGEEAGAEHLSGVRDLASAGSGGGEGGGERGDDAEASADSSQSAGEDKNVDSCEKEVSEKKPAKKKKKDEKKSSGYYWY